MKAFLCLVVIIQQYFMLLFPISNGKEYHLNLTIGKMVYQNRNRKIAYFQFRESFIVCACVCICMRVCLKDGQQDG